MPVREQEVKKKKQQQQQLWKSTFRVARTYSNCFVCKRDTWLNCDNFFIHFVHIVVLTTAEQVFPLPQGLFLLNFQVD